MAAISSDHIAVSSTILTAPPAPKQAQPDLTPRQSSTPPVASYNAPDFSVSISPEARDAAAKARTAGRALNGGADAATEQKSSSSAETKTAKRTKAFVPADGSNAQIVDEKGKLWEELRKKTERRKEDIRNEDEKLRLEEESANAAERRKIEQKKAEKSVRDNQGGQGNILNTLYEANRSGYANRMLIDAAISGRQSKQSGKAVSVVGGASTNATTLFIQRGSNRSRPSINLFV